MQSLRILYDEAKAADERVAGIMAEMLAAFEEDTDEGRERALAMRDALEEAKAEARAANELYIAARDAAAEADEAARKFVPVDGANSRSVKEITRAEYERLDYAARHAFLSAGGSIVENPAE